MVTLSSKWALSITPFTRLRVCRRGRGDGSVSHIQHNNAHTAAYHWRVVQCACILASRLSPLHIQLHQVSSRETKITTRELTTTAISKLKVPVFLTTQMRPEVYMLSHSLQLLGGGEKVVLVHLHFPQTAHQLKTLHRTLQYNTRQSHPSERFNRQSQVCL